MIESLSHLEIFVFHNIIKSFHQNSNLNLSPQFSLNKLGIPKSFRILSFTNSFSTFSFFFHFFLIHFIQKVHYTKSSLKKRIDKTMSSTVQNLYEVTESHLSKDRSNQCSNSIGLGPDDLVILTKREKGIFQGDTAVLSYHQVVGFDFVDKNSFSLYFHDLLKRQNKKGFNPFSSTYTISRGRLIAFNSFKKVDVSIIATPADKNAIAELSDSKGEKVPISEEIWNELRMSSALRFYRSSQPILYSLFGSRFQFSNALHVFSLRNQLTYEDFCYIVTNHPISDELVASITTGLIISLSQQQIVEFVSNYGARLPTIFYHFFRYLNPSNAFCKKLFEFTEVHLETFCDDIQTLSPYLFYQIKNKNFDAVLKFYPTLVNSFWSNPLCGIILAKIAFMKNDLIKSLSYLNAACFSKNWPATPTKGSRFVLTNDKKSKYTNFQQESKIFNTPFVGANAEYFKCVYSLIQNDGFKDAWNCFCDPGLLTNSKKREECKNKQLKLTNSNLDNSPFPFPNSRNISPTLKHAANDQKYCSIWPRPNYNIVEEKNDDLLFLYDPGIVIDENKPLFEVLNELPVSPFLLNVVQDSKSMLKKRKEYMTSKKEIDSGQSQIYSMLIQALRSDDQELLEHAKELAKKIGVLTIEKALFLYAQIRGYNVQYPEIVGLKIQQTTQTELNAIVFLETLLIALERLNISS